MKDSTRHGQPNTENARTGLGFVRQMASKAYAAAIAFAALVLVVAIVPAAFGDQDVNSESGFDAGLDAALASIMVSGTDEQWEAAGYAYNSNAFEDGNARFTLDHFKAGDGSYFDCVTPVKIQNPWGSGWGFSAIAASESSILSELAAKYPQYARQKAADSGAGWLDLSELQLVWMALTPLLADDESGHGGEGLANLSGNPFSGGGVSLYAASLFSSGVGPLYEERAPYRNAEGTTVTGVRAGEEYTYYSPEGDWSVSEDNRFRTDFHLDGSALLPETAGFVTYVGEASGNCIRTDMGGYTFVGEGEGDWLIGKNDVGIEAIKKELAAGRAVSIAYFEDGTDPDNPSQGDYYISPSYADYTYNMFDAPSANHVVTIVGWDDTYSRDNFRQGTDALGNTMCPPGDGAWIVKNSWGSQNSSDFNVSAWGADDTEGNRSGYFYLSYYEPTLQCAETFDFNIEYFVNNTRDSYRIDEYDFMPVSGVDAFSGNVAAGDDFQMANVFYTKDEACFLREVGTLTFAPGTTVDYSVYLLDENESEAANGDEATEGKPVAADPCAGTLIATLRRTYEYGGYHREALLSSDAATLLIPANRAYSVVVRETTDNESISWLPVGYAFNKECIEAYGMQTYGTAIIHRGESFVSLKNGDDWMDWVDYVDEKSSADFAILAVDNVSIKAYLDPMDDGESVINNTSYDAVGTAALEGDEAEEAVMRTLAAITDSIAAGFPASSCSAVSSGAITASEYEAIARKLSDSYTAYRLVAVVSSTALDDTDAAEAKNTFLQEIPGGNVASIFDISIKLYVENTGTGSLVDITDNPILLRSLDGVERFSIALPDELADDGITFFIVANHGGAIERLKTEMQGGRASFDVGLFSTFALCYEMPDPVPAIDDAGGTAAPATGDATYAGAIALVVMVVLALLVSWRARRHRFLSANKEGSL